MERGFHRESGVSKEQRREVSSENRVGRPLARPWEGRGRRPPGVEAAVR